MNIKRGNFLSLISVFTISMVCAEKHLDKEVYETEIITLPEKSSEESFSEQQEYAKEIKGPKVFINGEEYEVPPGGEIEIEADEYGNIKEIEVNDKGLLEDIFD